MFRRLLNFLSHRHQPSGAELRQLQAEGILFQHPSVPVSVHYENYRAPGRRFEGKTQWGRCCVICTHDSFRVYTWGRRILGFRFANLAPSDIACSVGADGSLLIRANAAHTQPGASGTVETRLTIPEAASVVDRWTAAATAPTAPVS